MDVFQVPKKINRHVLKALNALDNENANNDYINTAQILQQVKLQMRNLVPVRNIDTAVKKSLKNLSDIGLINRIGDESFSIFGSYDYMPVPDGNMPNSVNPKLFKSLGPHKRSVSQLNPNTRLAQLHSQDSLSGDEYDRTRKRLRTNNKKIRYAGRNTNLPKAKQHHLKNIALRDNLIDTNLVNMTLNNFQNDDSVTEIINDKAKKTNIEQPTTEVGDHGITKVYSNVNYGTDGVSTSMSVKSQVSMKESGNLLYQPNIQKSSTTSLKSSKSQLMPK